MPKAIKWYVSSSRREDVLLVAACTDALLDYPSPGTRVGAGHPRGPRGTGTVAYAEAESKDGAWQIAIPKDFAPLFRNRGLHRSDDEPLDTLPIGQCGIDWMEMAGFFREYLYDLDPNLQFDILALEAKPDGKSGAVRSVDAEVAIDDDYWDVAYQCFEERMRSNNWTSIELPLRYRVRPEHEIMDMRLCLSRAQWSEYPRVHRRSDLAGLCESFPEAYVLVLCAYLLTSRTPRSWEYREVTSRTLRRRAGSCFLRAIMSGLTDGRSSADVFSELTAMASAAYESRSATGRLTFCRTTEPRLDWILRFSAPIPLTERKKSRKVLEMSGQDTSLISDGNSILGLGRLKESRFLAYLVEFKGEEHWEVREVGSLAPLIVVDRGEPRVPSSRIDFDTFRTDLERNLPGLDEAAMARVFEIAQGAVAQRHGTGIVVCDDAATEAERLKDTALLVAATILRKEDVESVSAIDGAVLVDMDGRCHAVGVILDGTADGTRGDSARGARYNSLIRYVSARREHGRACAALIVSEDGDVSWTELPPIQSA